MELLEHIPLIKLHHKQKRSTRLRLSRFVLRVRLYRQMKIIPQLYLFLELTSPYKEIQALQLVVSRVLSLVMQKTLVVLYSTLTHQLVELIHMTSKKVKKFYSKIYQHLIQIFLSSTVSKEFTRSSKTLMVVAEDLLFPRKFHRLQMQTQIQVNLQLSRVLQKQLLYPYSTLQTHSLYLHLQKEDSKMLAHSYATTESLLQMKLQEESIENLLKITIKYLKLLVVEIHSKYSQVRLQ